jgi:aminomethyltransferase
MPTALAQTPLHDWHVAHGGRMVDFAGWSMPVQYSSIAAEHAATRNAVGVFDISHMGRLDLIGPLSTTPKFIDRLVSRRVTDMKDFQARYALVCNEAGGILDDILVYQGVPKGLACYQLVVNASNREKIVAWIEKQLRAKSEFAADIRLEDCTLDSAMIAVQGPKALEIVERFVTLYLPEPVDNISAIRYYFAASGTIGAASVMVSRTGYTGEDGFEIICHADDAPTIWEKFIAAAEAVGGMAAGLGARDTLRLEAAMPLYGHELSEEINPIQAGLKFAVNLEGRDFIGRDALLRFAADKNQPVRIGLQLDGKRVPRQGCGVLQGNEAVGEVTSGTFSPTFERPIAMAYVRPSVQAVGTQLTVDIRGTAHPGTVVPLPFYSRKQKY